jgi:4a-hydroxytetrahydrobiopterin dehydratase
MSYNETIGFLNVLYAVKVPRREGRVLGRDSPAADLVDPRGRWPGFWFEQMNEPRGDGGGAIHVAMWVPYEQAEARIAAALAAAGGRMVRDEFAPSWWTLGDRAGNEVDIATTRGRD